MKNVLFSTTMIQNQFLLTIDNQILKSVLRSSYQNNRTDYTVITDKSLHNEVSFQGTRSFVCMTASSDNDDVQFPSISAMREFSDKSIKKLRLEDNVLTYK